MSLGDGRDMRWLSLNSYPAHGHSTCGSTGKRWVHAPRARAVRVDVALCWAGGAGSLLALDALLAEGHRITLVHAPTQREWGRRVRALPTFLVEAQAAALDLPLRLAGAGAQRETDALADAAAASGATHAAFGFVRGEEHVGWKLGKTLRARGLEPLLPVRHQPPGEAARILVDRGARLVVRAVATGGPRHALGRVLDEELVDDVDAAYGRAGWSALRTFTTGGPPFAKRVDVVSGETVEAEDGVALALALAGC